MINPHKWLEDLPKKTKTILIILFFSIIIIFFIWVIYIAFIDWNYCTCAARDFSRGVEIICEICENPY